MENINVLISKKTRMVTLSKSTLGNDGENLQENLVFSFVDEFVDGTARLEITMPDDTSSYAMLTKVDETYQLPVKSVMTQEGKIAIQLVIVEGESAEEIPIFKSNVSYLRVRNSINAEIEQEESYSQWIDVASEKLNELDSAINDASNLDLDVSKSGSITTLTLTDKEGETKSVSILDGQTGASGSAGRDGNDGITPTIGNNGNWYLGDTDTGKPSRGIQGETGQTGASGSDGVDGISPTVLTSKSGNTTTITITDKLGEHTATITDGINGTDGRDGYVQYTAGDNITIENNVISAVGGGTQEIYELQATSLNSPLDLSTLKKGNYYSSGQTSSNKIYYKVNESSQVKNFTTDMSVIKLWILKTQDEIQSSNDIFGYVLYYSYPGAIVMKALKYNVSDGEIQSTINSGSTYQMFGSYVINELGQTFSGVKTFNSLPQLSSYIAPTSDVQLVPKKYVDDKISEINSILETLTNSGGN